MKRSMFKGFVFVLVVLGLLAGSFFAGRLLVGPETVQARTQTNPVSPASTDASYGCYVNNVAAFHNRIHLRCSVPIGSISYFAYPTGGSNGYTASRMLAVAQTAFALGKGVVVFYDSSSASNPPDCNISDCRLMTGVSMVN